MLTSKQRAYLRSLANPIDTILMVGKGGMSGQIIKQADDALTARELIKGKVLNTADVSPREAANAIAQELQADVVQVIGTKFVLYRKTAKSLRSRCRPGKNMCDVKPLQRVGMLGGSFNPPHLGHIRLARTFITALHLDLVLFIPACIPPHKSSCGMASAEDRCNMCRILIEKDAKIQVSDMEIRRGGASYTADTLQTLRAAYPKRRFI